MTTHFTREICIEIGFSHDFSNRKSIAKFPVLQIEDVYTGS
jgi:hypothetical protein